MKAETERSQSERVEEIGGSGASVERIVSLLLFLTVFLYIAVCPYTKVEESFNLQAIHDLLHHGSDIELYDHLTFPGVVPRTFLGPLAVSSLSLPLTLLSDLAGCSKFSQQLIVRGVLGSLVMAAFSLYRAAVRERYGRTVSVFLSLLTLSQFHLMFYSSRPLPNTLALGPVLAALACWLQGRSDLFIFLSAGAILVFRGELAIFLGAILLMELLVGKVDDILIYYIKIKQLRLMFLFPGEPQPSVCCGQSLPDSLAAPHRPH